jgi:hypothetical protein
MSSIKGDAELSSMTLAPFSVYIGEIKKAAGNDEPKQ